ncbi:hypothetical protein CFN78_09470 [Amycolatopsis antarctica]|uniref:YbaB/EbfC family DNA-binding protein n=1 Tax=Amycolatopsis antarctica TaxID=1854586 RepID=A0A263D5J0_9PSEU|nr:YbaB/EbfC family nucleoid-associated protein [Amycolatopsis antarctica]OZM73730.1 hypothetical protein CFN78_09470 [Amycolatopsis antarctica]
MADLSDVERMVADWERGATEKAARYEQMQRQVEQISITESVASGAVSVTVGHNGLPTDVRMTEAVKSMAAEEIAAAVLAAMRKAQSRYPERLAEITAATVGDDTTTRHILATATEQFPAPLEEDEPSAPEAPRARLYDREPEDEPAPPRAPRPRADGGRGGGATESDGDDFGGESFMRRD